MAKLTKMFRSADGMDWTVEVTNPGASNAMVVFHHPSGSNSRLDRYAWFITRGPEARSVTARMTKKQVMDAMNAADIAELFRRSMSISPSSMPRKIAG